MPGQLPRRRECDHCRVQSFNRECLNCGGKMRPVAAKPPVAPEHVAATRKPC